MKSVNVFYQTEKSPEFNHLEVTPEHTIGTVRALIQEKHGADRTAFLFQEDGDEPIDDGVTVGAVAGRAGLKLHLHRCRHIEVAVNYAGRTVARAFAPSATLARIKRWAAEQVGMTPDDATEHVLQIAGTQEHPAPGTHVGSLATCPTCRVAFDLVPEQRVNGGSGISGR